MGWSVLVLQNKILEMIARGEGLEATVSHLCHDIEALLPDVVCAVLRVDRSGLTHPLAGPSLPEDYLACLDGMLIGPQAGSCGTAAYLGEPVIVSDIASDDRWVTYRATVLELGMKACWSMPIFAADGIVSGTFAFYCRVQREPDPTERRFLESCVHLCEIALHRHERVLDRELRAVTDALTQLPNRRAFNQAITQLPRDTPGSWAILILDLDNLKQTNDTFGHGAGDVLIQVVSARIAAHVIPDPVFRIGGDEFAILVRQTAALHDLDAFAAAILNSIAAPVDCKGSMIAPAATVGGAVFMERDQDPETIKQNADFALYHAKDSGRGGFVRYWPGLDTRITQRMMEIRELDLALKDGRIEVRYQPIIDIQTGGVAAFEALCRLRTPDGNIVTASEMRDAMADARLSTAVTGRMLELIQADLAHWEAGEIPCPPVAINISITDLRAGHFLDQFRTVLRGRPIEPELLSIEVPAKLFHAVEADELNAELHILQNAGFRITIDDIGAAAVPFVDILTAPMDAMKVDVSLLAAEMSATSGKSYIEAMLLIARRLGIPLVAKGIGDADCLEIVRALGCRFGQGMHLAPPLSSHDAKAMLDDRSPSLAFHFLEPSIHARKKLVLPVFAARHPKRRSAGRRSQMS